MYILECSDGSYYTGSTTHLELRFAQHQSGEGANHTRKHLPVKLLYYEEFDRIDKAFEREKQVQGWSRKKKEALISNNMEELHLLSVCSNKTHYSYGDFDSADFGSAQSPELKSRWLSEAEARSRSQKPKASSRSQPWNINRTFRSLFKFNKKHLIPKPPDGQDQ